MKLRHALFALALLFLASPTFAVGLGGPDFVWDKILTALAQNLVGVVAFAGGAIAIVIAALAWAFGDSREAGRRIGQAIIAVAIAVGGGLLVGQIATSVGAVI